MNILNELVKSTKIQELKRFKNKYRKKFNSVKIKSFEIPTYLNQQIKVAILKGKPFVISFSEHSIRIYQIGMPNILNFELFPPFFIVIIKI